MKKSIVSFDLDMTLLDHATFTIPDSAAAALDALRKNYYVVLATARDMDMSTCREYLDCIRPDAVIHNDGTKITVGDRLIYETFMPKELVLQILEFAAREGLSVGVPTEDGDYFTNPSGVEEIDRLRWGESKRRFRDPWLLSEMNVRTMMYIGRPEGAERIAAGFPQLDCPLIASRLGCGIQEKEKSKAKGLLRLCEYFGVDIGDCYAFGDSMNDYEIIKTVGTGIAMGNAVPELKEAADYVTADVGDDGVYKACRHFGLI